MDAIAAPSSTETTLAEMVPCTKDTVRCANAKRYDSVLRECCRGHIRQIVRDVAESMTRRHVTWWLDYGSLLGAVRNPMTTAEDYPWLPSEDLPIGTIPPGILPHDKDADIGVLWSEWVRLMRVRGDLEDRGYWVRVNPAGAKLKVRLSRSNHLHLDIFGWRGKPGGYLQRPRYIQVDQFKGREFHWDAAFPLTTVEWEGMMLPAPKDPISFCAFRYGLDWHRPIPANHDGNRR